MRLKRQGLVVTAGLSSLLLLASCSAGSSAPNGAADEGDSSGVSGEMGDSSALPAEVDLTGTKVVSLFTSLNNDYYAAWDLGARRAVEAFGAEYVALTNEGDPAAQLSQFEQQIDAGATIFFVTAPDPANIPTMASIAEERGVCLANTWEQPAWTSPLEMGDAYRTYLTPYSVDDAYLVATALFEEMGGEGNFVHLTGQPGGTADFQRTAAVDRALEEYPGINLVAREAGKWNRDDARQAMSGIITQFGDEIDGVFGQNDDVGIGAVNAMKEAGIEDVPVTGMDGNEGTLELIQSGDMFATFSSLPWWQAGFSAVRAIDQCAGLQENPMNRQLWTRGLLVTSDNLDTYRETYLGDTDPFDWVRMSKVAYPEDWDPQGGIAVLDMNQMWAHADQPAGWEPPPAYSEGLAEVADLNAEWDSHWKLLR